MSMWSSRTNLWGKKTRLVNTKSAVKTSNGHDTGEDLVKEDEDYMEEQDKIKHLENKITFLKSLLDDKCKEIIGLQIQLKENNQFMQKIVLELIQLKNAPAPIASKTSLEAYIANKNASSTTKGRLP